MTVTNVCVTLVRSCEIFKSPESKFDQVYQHASPWLLNQQLFVLFSLFFFKSLYMPTLSFTLFNPFRIEYITLLVRDDS